MDIDIQVWCTERLVNVLCNSQIVLVTTSIFLIIKLCSIVCDLASNFFPLVKRTSRLVYPITDRSLAVDYCTKTWALLIEIIDVYSTSKYAENHWTNVKHQTLLETIRLQARAI
jgi:hypothetical protein